ncbi:hypothetical protein QZH41_006426 [Actinostola sp. cb2023]|nr:hypothetical protein QZH41_006426 [Actinostola sp. cb2023]
MRSTLYGFTTRGNFGLIQPTLIQQIKKILDQYPDDGQILKLLPLSNKTFTDFMKKSSCNAVYIDSSDHPKSLLPGMQAKFLDSDIDVDIKENLENAARKGYTQLRDFDKDAVENHLREALPTKWTQSNGHVIWRPGKPNHPTFQWLEELWGYFGRYFNDTNGLDGFRGLPLIPVSIENKKKIQLVRIQRPSSLVLQSFNCEQIDSSVSNVLSPFHVTVLKNLPVFLMRHHTLVPDYVNPPNPKGVLDALIMAVVSNPQSVSLMSLSDMRPLGGFLSRISTLTPKERDFLKKLKLFNTHPGSGGQSRPVALLEVPLAAPVDDFPPVHLCTDMVDLCDGSSRTLAQLLGTEPMSHVELVKIMLNHALHDMYSDPDIDGLVEYTLNRFNMYHGQDFEDIKRLLTCLPFIMSGGNTRKKPGELFDPEDIILREMFLDEPEKFPKLGSYYAKSNVLVHLRTLGLKKKTDVIASDILFSARMVNGIQDVMKATTKSEAILERLQHTPLLLQLVNSTTDPLFQLNSIPWVHVFDKRSETYPTALPRKYESSFACPKDATSAKFLYLVGSSKTLVDVQDNSQVSHCFGWDRVPSIDEVISHLRNVILSYEEKEKNTFISVIKAIYKYLASQDINNVIGELDVQQIHKWVWNGDGFSSPSEVILYVPCFNLQPYLCSLPSETKEFTTFFSECGMKLECDNNLLLNILRRIKERHVELEYNHNTSCHDVKRDLQYSIDILNALKPQNGEPFESGLRENLLVPVNVEDDMTLELVPVDECTYCDREWLKQGHDVIDIDDTDDVKIKFIHRNIPTATAEVLGVPTLMSRILDADELEMGESFGQSESLLDRLKSLLEGYTDGLSVPKELIQNADDAGATEVRFLYDERTNDDAMTHLIDEGMKECQGPALWSYNDAVFTNDDFQNIVKLNAATKEEDTGKIGRFGLGFNSVYNLTDVPSFVSRESIVILDPHTTYLGKAIRDKSKPGIKFNLTTKTLRRLANQFKPYNGIFGCDLRPDGSIKPYDGTLFRFPLRTKTQAHKSGIKQLHYDNVLTIRVYHLTNEKTGVPQPIELFSISKSCVDVIHRLTREVSLSIPVQRLTPQKQDFVKQSNILRVSSDLLKVIDKETIPPAQVLMKSALILTNPRQHPVERVFEDSWKPLQGPALCVYNNAPFTNSDIIGIQNLGEGNKGDDPNKTGQYGIGFNAVYHLTDVPSFISKGEEIGERNDDVEQRLDKNQSNDFQDAPVVINVMTHIYQFLETNLQNNESAITTGLQKTRCIVVEDGKRFVYPRQIVAELISDDEIYPYLFRVPPKLAGYSTLFEKLGATNTVTPAQYAMVLDYIRMECRDGKLDPNETTKAFKATKGLFESIKKNSGVTTSDLLSLYLPGVKRNPVDPNLKLVFLQKSTEIFYNDAPHFKERLEGFERLLFVKLKECELRVDNDDSMINQLPESIRPRKLTSFVHETLLENGQPATFSSAAQELRQILTSNEFCFGLTRLIKHASYERDMKTEDGILRNVQKSLRCIHVYSVPGLRTRLVCEGTTIPESEAAVACFEEKTEEGNQEVWKIYVEQKVDLKEFTSRVAEIINRITGHLLGEALVHLPMMLLKPLDEIRPLLDSLKIREDNTYLEAEATCFPTPGNFIHIEDHHLLVHAFTVFYPGEYVGYELDDPSLRNEDGAATYIYAIIIEEVPSGEEASPITKRYRINIGKELIVVDAVDLYTFCRRNQGTEGLEIEVFTGSETAEKQEVKPDNLDDAKRLVKKTLEEAWHLPEEKRKKIIKRLFLTWHPDKNPGNEEFCTEVFKFIQAEIKRLETGVDPQRAGNFGSSGGYGNFSSYRGYTHYYRRWSDRARDHGSQRSSYFSGGCSSSSYRRSNPQPGEATRWYRQATDDLNAASNDVNENRPSYEWACFKCHQSAEKALKAAQYSRDADKSSTHNLSGIAIRLGNSELSSLAHSVECLLGDSTRMRYPDRVQYPNIPHDIYTRDMAAQAVERAREILNVVKAKFV